VIADAGTWIDPDLSETMSVVIEEINNNRPLILTIT